MSLVFVSNRRPSVRWIWVSAKFSPTLSEKGGNLQTMITAIDGLRKQQYPTPRPTWPRGSIYTLRGSSYVNSNTVLVADFVLLLWKRAITAPKWSTPTTDAVEGKIASFFMISWSWVLLSLRPKLSWVICDCSWFSSRSEGRRRQGHGCPKGFYVFESIT